MTRKRQTACKPGSVPPWEQILGRGWPFLWDARRRAPRATDLSGGAKVCPAFPRTGMPAAPTWSCSRWGFPCRRRCRRRGALLPHRFTLAARPVFRDGTGGVLSVALSLGSPPPGVTRHRTSVEPGLSSLRTRRRAAIRPSGTSNLGIGQEGVEVRVLGFRAHGCAAPRNDHRDSYLTIVS